MVKILIVTHGPLAQAFKESSAMFFGDTCDEMETIGLFPQDSPEQLKDKITDKITAMDQGEGVMVFVDIFAGSPFNMTALAIDELKENHHIQCFTGVNMPFLMEALANKDMMKLDEMTTHLTGLSKDTIVNLRESLDL